MQAVILAGGESSRFWPFNKDAHKCQFKLLGKSLLYWTLKGLAENGVRQAVIVHRPGSAIPEMAAAENDLELDLVFAPQESPRGTGDALAKAKEHVTEPFFLLHPNKVNSGALAALMAAEHEKGAEIVLAGAHTDAPELYGVLEFEDGKPAAIVENPERGKEPSTMRTLGAYLLPPDFFQTYEALPKHHEADLIDALNLCLRQKQSAAVTIDRDIPTLKYPWDLFGLLDILSEDAFLQEYIAPSARIGTNVSIHGRVYVGENAVVKDNTVLEGPCYIGDNCEIGCSNVVRGPADLERGVKTGSFFEFKHSMAQEGTHFHSGYVGDSVIGRNCRIGAGFITANRRLDRATIAPKVQGERVDSGLDFLGAMMGDGVRVGIHAGAMPGVMIGPGAQIDPMAAVYSNVADGERLKA